MRSAASCAGLVEVGRVGDDKAMPAAPFDLVFFAFARILDGATPAEASGWDL